MLTEKELEQIHVESETLYPYPDDRSDTANLRLQEMKRRVFFSAVTKERERAKLLLDALNEWATAKNEFDSGYSNKSGTMTRMNIAALSSAMQGAELKLYRIFKEYTNE